MHISAYVRVCVCLRLLVYLVIGKRKRSKPIGLFLAHDTLIAFHPLIYGIG